MLKRLFACVMLLATLIIILVICVSISPSNRDVMRYSDNNLQDVSSNNTSQKIAYLTFDDGPSRNTKRILDILDKYNIKATFFVVASLVNEEYGKQLASMNKAGHSIGIHTYSHNYNQIYLSKDEYLKDFQKAEDVISNYINKKSNIYRFPGGSCNCFIGDEKDCIIEQLERKNYIYFDWNVSGEDSRNNPSVDSIINNVVKDYKNFDKPIILLHDGVKNDNTVYALSTIIENIKNAGYEFDVLR